MKQTETEKLTLRGKQNYEAIKKRATMKIKKLLSGHSTDSTFSLEHKKSQGTNTTNSFLSCEENNVVITQSKVPSLLNYSELQASSQWLQQNCAQIPVTFLHSPGSSGEIEISQPEIIKDQLQDGNEKQLSELKKELDGRDRLIQQQKHQLDEAMRNLTLANKAKAFLTAQLADQDKKLAFLEQYRDPTLIIHEELQVARDALQSLRKGFRRNDSHHHTIDTLEQSIALLMERLHFAEMEKVVTESIHKQLSSVPYGSIKRYKQALPSNNLSSVWNSQNYPKLTKVIYFTDKTITPYLTSIPKRLGEITLKDFKQLVDQPANNRFHFKALDPEYGMVKEEVLQDDDILPGWEDKIIAWVETDHG